MTAEQAQKELLKFHHRQHNAERAIIDFARSLPMVLKDAGFQHQGNELERLYFQLDTEKQDLQTFIEQNSGPSLEVITRVLAAELKNP